MLININLDELKAREKTLTDELENVRGLISLVERAAVADKTQAKTNHGYTKNGGCKQRDLILALYTGPLNIGDLMKALSMSRKRAGVMISGLFRNRVAVYQDDGVHLVLTAEGQKRARWFLANPEYLVYVPFLPETKAAL